MNKKVNKRQAVESRTLDELALFSDDELMQRSSFLYDEASRRDETRAYPFEVELAYVQREQQIRIARKQAHRQYLDQLRAEEVDESKLPEYQGNTMPSWLFY